MIKPEKDLVEVPQEVSLAILVHIVAIGLLRERYGFEVSEVVAAAQYAARLICADLVKNDGRPGDEDLLAISLFIDGGLRAMQEAGAVLDRSSPREYAHCRDGQIIRESPSSNLEDLKARMYAEADHDLD